MPRIPFGPYTPDLPSLANGATAARNVIPARGSYRPLASLEVASTALSARCQGLISVQDTSGNVNVFAGSAAKIERLTSGATAWEDVSGTAYSTATDGRWSFTFDGIKRVVATNFGDAPQSYVIGASTDFADLSADAPKGKYCAIIKNALFLANVVDATDGTQPNRAHWSKRGDLTSWPAVGGSTAIAGESSNINLRGNLGAIMGVESGMPGADGMIWQEKGLWRVVYVGGDQFYAFDLIEGSRGTPAPSSIVSFPGGIAYLGEDGFYATDGASVRPIGASIIDKRFFAEVDQSHLERISGQADPINKVVVWSYPASGNNGVPNRLLLWNFETGGFAISDGIGNHEILVRTQAVGYSLDSLDDIYPSLDAMDVSLDSRALTGGRLVLAAVDTAHKVNTFTGATMAATVTTTESDIGDGKLMFVSGVVPLIEGTDVTPTVTPITRNRQSDAPTTGTASVLNSAGYCPIRATARYMRAQVDIPAGSTWQHGVGVDVPADKMRAAGSR